jgi:hypothetical protein
MSAKAGHASDNRIPDFETINGWSYFLDDPKRFVSEYHWQFVWLRAQPIAEIGMAKAGCDSSNEYFAFDWSVDLHVFNGKRLVELLKNGCAHTASRFGLMQTCIAFSAARQLKLFSTRAPGDIPEGICITRRL